MIAPHFILGVGIILILSKFILAFICFSFGRIFRRFWWNTLPKSNQSRKLAQIHSKFKLQQAHPTFSLRINT